MNNSKKMRLKARLLNDQDEILPCAFCHRNVDNETFYGKLYAIGEIQCHYFCVLLSSCLIQKGKDSEGLLGFMYNDIIAEINRSKKHKCSYCNREGATLGCSISQCRKQFHLPCGREKDSVSMFFGNYKSFCQLHRPKQKISDAIMVKAKARMSETKKKSRSKIACAETSQESQESASQNTDPELVCVICYEAVEGYPTRNTFWPPCCGRDAWFHRSCVERMSLSAGVHFLKCPLCNDKDVFHKAVASQGFYIPDRDAAWELEQNAFADMYERSVRCDASICKCPMGRDYDAEMGDWDIELCLLCGSTGSHAGCGSRPYVCVICRPAVSEDLETVHKRIQDVIQQESRRDMIPRGPRMPTRISLRRSKLLSNTHIPSSSGAKVGPCNKKDSKKDQLTSLENSRLELNLKSPREILKNLKAKTCIDIASKSPKKSLYPIIDNEIKSLLKTAVEDTNLSPLKLLQNSIMADRLTSPMKTLEEVCGKMADAYSTIDKEKLMALRSKLKQPRPMSKKRNIFNKIFRDLIQGVLNDSKTKKEISYEKDLATPGANILCAKISDSEANKENALKSTRALGSANKAKKLEYSSNISENNESETKEQCSKEENQNLSPPKSSTPKKCQLKNYQSKIDNKVVTLSEVTKQRANNENDPIQKSCTFLNDFNIIINEDESKSKEVSVLEGFNDKTDDNKNSPDEISTPVKLRTVAENFVYKITKPDTLLDETTDENNKNILLQNTSTSKKLKYLINKDNEAEIKVQEDTQEKVDVINNYNMPDDSSNSTFQLPPEFIANNESDESLPVFETPKKSKTIDLQNDSMEISKDDKTVNISLTKVSPETTGVLKEFKTKSPVKGMKCSFKFSTLDKEALQTDNLDIDIESFKNHYLNEVNGVSKGDFIKKSSKTEKNVSADIDYEKRATIRKENRKRKLVTDDGPCKKSNKIDKTQTRRKYRKTYKFSKENFYKKRNVETENINEIQNANLPSIEETMENASQTKHEENVSMKNNYDIENDKIKSVKLKKGSKSTECAKKIFKRRIKRDKSDKNGGGNIEIQNLINYDGVSINQKLRVGRKHNKKIKIKFKTEDKTKRSKRRSEKKVRKTTKAIPNDETEKILNRINLKEKPYRKVSDKREIEFIIKINERSRNKIIKKRKTEHHTKKVQTVLSPDSVTDKILVPSTPVVPPKRKYIMHKKNNDNLKQTNIMTFFVKTLIE